MGILLDCGLNVVRNDEFVDHEGGYLFMRTAFDGEVDAQDLEHRVQQVLPVGARVRFSHRGRKRIVILAGKEPHCLGDLLVRYRYGNLNADVLAVISNHDTLQGLVEAHRVPFHLVSHVNLERDAHEGRVLELLDFYGPEYLVLAKYMRVLTASFVERFAERIINIHHSFLPAFVGKNPYRQAYERGVKLIGATAHFVTTDLDEGPIIAQAVTDVSHRFTARNMAEEGRIIEKAVISKALDLVCEDRVFVYANRTVIL